MSAWDDLKRASEAAKALTAQYEALSTQKDEIEHEAHTNEDPAVVKRCIEQLKQIAEKAKGLVTEAQRLDPQLQDAYTRVEDEAHEMKDKPEDGLNDIQGYAVDWPDEIEAVVDDLNQWLEDEGHKRNASAVSAKAGAHFLYR